MNDQEIIAHIENLMQEERTLLDAVGLKPDEENRLHEIQVERDQYWDLLRQRRALRDAGDDPEKAQIRPPDVVEHYKQ
jgi:hypothetical protein